MQIMTIPVGALAANCYILISQSGAAAVIDPGDEAERIISLLHTNKLAVQMILLTHGHFDHMNAAETLRQELLVPVFVHEADGGMLQSAARSLSIAVSGEFHPVREFTPWQDGQVLALGEIGIRCMHTPGHSPGSAVYLAGDAMFSGDTLFCGSIGRTDFPGSSIPQMSESLKRLSKLPGDYRIYPGHDRETTLSGERRTNPYLRESV